MRHVVFPRRCVAAAVLVLASAALLAGPLVMPVAGSEEARQTELYKKMEAIQTCYDQLRPLLADKSRNADALKLVIDMQRLTLDCKELEPFKIKEVPQEGRAAYLLKYRQEMVALMEELMKLELMVFAGGNDDAQRQLRQIQRLKFRGHDQFQD